MTAAPVGISKPRHDIKLSAATQWSARRSVRERHRAGPTHKHGNGAVATRCQLAMRGTSWLWQSLDAPFAHVVRSFCRPRLFSRLATSCRRLPLIRVCSGGLGHDWQLKTIRVLSCWHRGVCGDPGLIGVGLWSVCKFLKIALVLLGLQDGGPHGRLCLCGQQQGSSQLK